MQQQERTGQHTKKQHGFSRSNKPVHFTWPALLADQTGDGENFMRRYLQIGFRAFRQNSPLPEMFSVSSGRRYDVQRRGLHGASVIVTVSRNVRWVQKTGIKVQNKSRSRRATGFRI
jgi:hypothetical protein